MSKMRAADVDMGWSSWLRDQHNINAEYYLYTLPDLTTVIDIRFATAEDLETFKTKVDNLFYNNLVVGKLGTPYYIPDFDEDAAHVAYREKLFAEDPALRERYNAAMAKKLANDTI